MDAYTHTTQRWLDDRFGQTDESGIYIAHQPIYGFRKGHCDTALGAAQMYNTTYHIMRALSRIRFDSLLDIGGAEGYKAALARSLFGVSVRSCDLSAEACARAREIFGIDGEPVDICNLPFGDNSFDVVLCSETLEHVPDIERATRECVRVSRNAVVISVPHEPPSAIARYAREKIPHAHLHSVGKCFFDFALPSLAAIVHVKTMSPLLRRACVLVDAAPVPLSNNWKDFYKRWYHLSIPLVRKLAGRRAAAFLMSADRLFTRLFFLHSGQIFILVKNSAAVQRRALKKISPVQIIDFSVPFHYPFKERHTA